MYQILYKILDTLFLNIVSKDKTYNTISFKNLFLETKYTINYTSKTTTPPNSVFCTKNSSDSSFLSKALSYTNYSLTLIDKFSLGSYYKCNSSVYQKNTIITTLIPQNTQNNPTKLFSSLTSNESFYNNSLNTVNAKINTTLLTLNYLNKFLKESRHSINFNFNLKENLNVSNQQR
jgi:hypothetical protein